MKHVFEQSANGAVVCTSVEHGRQRAWEKTQQVAGVLSKQVQDKLQMAAAEESIRATEVGKQVGPSQQRCDSFFKPIIKSQSVPKQHTVCVQVAALKAEWARQEEETKSEELRRQMRMQQLRIECEEFNRCSSGHLCDYQVLPTRLRDFSIW